MTTLTVGPTSSFPTIAAAMLAAGPADTILLETGYGNESTTVTHNGMIVTGGSASTGIVLQLGTGIATFFLGGTAPINVLADANGGNGITANAGDNVVTVTGGINAVDGGLGVDRLVVDYRLATGAITGNSTSNFSEAGGGGRSVTITDGTFEHFTVLTGSGADTLTVGDGNNVINAGDGANTITAGNGQNNITGGVNADTITAGNGGNTIDAGNGTNTITSGLGDDTIFSGTGADTIIAGGGVDAITIRGGSDEVDGGAGNDRLIVDYSGATTDVSGGVTGGNLGSGYTGHLADASASQVDVVEIENFTITTGSGNDVITTGDGNDVITAGAGNDTLDGGGGNDTLTGGDGSDVLTGGLGADTLSGGAGADYLRFDGSDVGISGGADFDSAFAQTSAPVTLDMGTASIEWAQGNSGADTFNAATQSGAVYIYGMGGDDTLTGSAFGDFLDGGDGSDTLAGGDGADLLFGNGGSDILLGQGGDDSLIEMGGDSQIDGGAGFDSLFVWSDTGVSLNLATASIEWVQGSVLGDDNLNGAGNTVNTYLYGWGGNDTLTGGSGNDYIAGGAGNDVLTGGGGNDTMIGEGGTDRYVYTAANWGSDTIHSFDPNGEKLDFTAVAAIHSFADFTTFEWDAGNLGYNSTTLFYNDGGTTSAITLIGVQVASLSDSDFLFV